MRDNLRVRFSDRSNTQGGGAGLAPPLTWPTFQADKADRSIISLYVEPYPQNPRSLPRQQSPQQGRVAVWVVVGKLARALAGPVTYMDASMCAR